MRITTCAYDAAGKKVRASNAAIATFFIIDRFLQGVEFPESGRRSGLLTFINAMPWK
jgi:hypothetical protein